MKLNVLKFALALSVCSIIGQSNAQVNTQTGSCTDSSCVPRTMVVSGSGSSSTSAAYVAPQNNCVAKTTNDPEVACPTGYTGTMYTTTTTSCPGGRFGPKQTSTSGYNMAGCIPGSTPWTPTGPLPPSVVASTVNIDVTSQVPGGQPGGPVEQVIQGGFSMSDVELREDGTWVTHQATAPYTGMFGAQPITNSGRFLPAGMTSAGMEFKFSNFSFYVDGMDSTRFYVQHYYNLNQWLNAVTNDPVYKPGIFFSQWTPSGYYEHQNDLTVHRSQMRFTITVRNRATQELMSTINVDLKALN